MSMNDRMGKDANLSRLLAGTIVEANHARARAERAEAERDALKAENATLKESLGELTQTNKTLRNRVNTVERSRNKAQSRLGQVLDECTKHKTSKSKLATKNAALRATIEHVQGELSVLKTMLAVNPRSENQDKALARVMEVRQQLSEGLHPEDETKGCGNCHVCLVGVAAPGVAGLPITATRMIVCPECGNKRCPKATDHRLGCTHSNEPGQLGSIYSDVFLPKDGKGESQ